MSHYDPHEHMLYRGLSAAEGLAHMGRHEEAAEVARIFIDAFEAEIADPTEAEEIRTDGGLTAEEVRTREPPAEMDTRAIQQEAESLGVHMREAGPDLTAAIEARYRQMESVLQDRLDAERPRCPNCQGDVGREPPNFDIICIDTCAPLPEATKAAFKDYQETIWRSELDTPEVTP